MKLRAKLYLVVVLLALAMPACPETIGQVKKLLDGPSVMVTGVVTYVKPGECYIESGDRASGIWVKGNTAAILPGDEVVAAGSISTINGERVVNWSALYPTGDAKLVTPLGMPLSRIGGSWFGYQDCASDRKPFTYQWQGQEYEDWRWVPAVGLNNTGLLVTTWGRVTSTDCSPTNGLRWFHLDDGSGMISDLGDKGVIVYSDADVKYGQMVSVTGISAVEAGIDDPTHLVRVIRPRSVVDVQVVGEPLTGPNAFSDEFDGDKLDPRWNVLSNFKDPYGQPAVAAGEISLAANPGWLTFNVPITPGSQRSYSPQITQSAKGDWDLDLKLRVNLPSQQDTSCGVYVIMGSPGYMFSGVTLAMVSSYSNGMGWLYVNSQEVHYLGPTADTTWYFRISRRGGILTGRYSQDGVSYSREYSTSLKCPDILSIFSIAGSLGQATSTVSAVIDYIRFTPVNEQGGL